MLKTRIIPTILWKDENTVKGVGFDSWRRVGTVLPSVKVYNLRQVDELIVLDITATHDNRRPDFATVKEFASDCFVPLTVGGGISSVSDVKELLRSGADKISINTLALENPQLISDIANTFGNQCVVVSIDAKKINGEYYSYSHSGTRISDQKVTEWAREVERRGAGEILITSIENDGTMQGYDLDLIRLVTDSVKIPVIASGGAGKYDDMYHAIHDAHASAVAASAMFIFTQSTPLEAKKFLRDKEINVRI